MGLQSLCHDLQLKLGIVLYTDSTAARGICNRRGVGKVRHMDVQLLWLQERIQSKEFALRKVDSALNLGDLSTKYVDAATIGRIIGLMGMAFSIGRSTAAPNLQGAGSHA